MKKHHVVLFVMIFLLLDVYILAVIINSKTHSKIYENKEVGFTMAYPESWSKAEAENSTSAQGGISFEGNEGSVVLDWTDDVSTWVKYPNKCEKGEKAGGEQPIGWETLQINGDVLQGCHLIYNGNYYSMESWTATKLLPNKVYTVIIEEKGQTEVNRKHLMQVISTLKLLK